ncbi:MAG: tryptophan--tRNA ligase [archaeon]
MSEEDFEVTPFEVEGKVDYSRLIEEFGTEEIDNELLKRIKRNTGELHQFLRRKYFYSHRDMDKILDEYEKGESFFLYTGMGPSSKMHIGHLPALMFTKWLQDKFDVNLYIQVTDDEKFLFKDKEYREIQENAEDNIEDISALGFDPEKTFIFKNTEYAGKLYGKAIKVANRITYSQIRSVFGLKNSSNIGSLFYPAMQIVPTLFEKKRCLIPSAIEQDPYWRVQRDVAPKLGYKKTAAIHSKLLPGLKGPEGKMSSSEPSSTIFLDEDIDKIPEKINKYAYSGGQPSLEEHRKKGGNPDVDTSFQWLNIFLEDDDEKIMDIRRKYKSGEMLTGELKQITIEKLQNFLKDFQEKKRKAKDDVNKYMYDGKLARKMWE